MSPFALGVSQPPFEPVDVAMARPPRAWA
jgi:hypothetical protein